MPRRGRGNPIYGRMVCRIGGIDRSTHEILVVQGSRSNADPPVVEYDHLPANEYGISTLLLVGTTPAQNLCALSRRDNNVRSPRVVRFHAVGERRQEGSPPPSSSRQGGRRGRGRRWGQ